MKRLLSIALGSVCQAQLAACAGTNKNVPLMRVYGEAQGMQVSRPGNVTVMGDFRAVNSETNEEFQSAVIYLPRGMQEILISAMDSGKDGYNIVRFGYDIWAEPEPNRKSYSIGFADLLEDDGQPDPLKNFAEGLGKSQMPK